MDATNVVLSDWLKINNDFFFPHQRSAKNHLHSATASDWVPPLELREFRQIHLLKLKKATVDRGFSQ